MKPINTFEDAKQAVADKCGVESWAGLCAGCTVDELDCLYEEVCELYADSRSRKAANEAVKADRKHILKECVEDMFLKEPNWDSADFFPVIDKPKVRNFPLPFPEES